MPADELCVSRVECGVATGVCYLYSSSPGTRTMHALYDQDRKVKLTVMLQINTIMQS